MSRAAPAAPRNLTLTEELEKLEQSITLTLQEIDSNFSKAHRIITSSILPLVEQYGENSKAVWEASKFWKQFFEASANVSLSGYEEKANDDLDDGSSALQDESTYQTGDSSAVGDRTTPRTGHGGEHDQTATSAEDEDDTAIHVGDESTLTDADGELTGSTPRVPHTQTIKPMPKFADLGSPYEAIRKQIRREKSGHQHGQSESESDANAVRKYAEASSKGQRPAKLPDMSMTPRSSLNPEEDAEENDDVFSTNRKKQDPLLHRLLDKNYRIQATPHQGTGLSPPKWKITAATQAKGKGKETTSAWQDDSIMDSPEIQVPKLRSEAFMSPFKTAYKNRIANNAPRTPGISVQTPMKGRTGKTPQDIFASREPSARRQSAGEATQAWLSDDEDDSFDLHGGLSPPKTIHFALPPSKLMQTPAREASKRIVDDILYTAGMEVDESEESPSVVKMSANLADDTF